MLLGVGRTSPIAEFRYVDIKNETLYIGPTRLAISGAEIEKCTLEQKFNKNYRTPRLFVKLKKA